MACCNGHFLAAFFVYYRSVICWAVFLLAASHLGTVSNFTLPSSPSLMGIYASPNCSGLNLLPRLLLTPGLNLNLAQPSSCHYSSYCGSASQGSLNLTVLNTSYLSLAAFAGSNCSGNQTYAARAVAVSPAGLGGCTPHATGSLLFATNYNDPEAAPDRVTYFVFIVNIILTRLPTLLFVSLLAATYHPGMYKLQLVDGYPVTLEEWEVGRAATASPTYLLAALLLASASQLLYASDYVQAAFSPDACSPTPSYFPYYFFWLSFAAELAALLALLLHIQLQHMARWRFCHGGSAGFTLSLPILLSNAPGPAYSPLLRPTRSPCTASTAATAAALALGAAAATSAATAAGAADPALAPLFNPAAQAVATAALALLWGACAALGWGCWAARGVSGIGCQRGWAVLWHSEPPRYATPQALAAAELFAPARLAAALRRALQPLLLRHCRCCARVCRRSSSGSRVAIVGEGAGEGGGAGGAGGAGEWLPPPPSQSELYILHLSPEGTAARLLSCLECWKAQRSCPGGGLVDGGQHNLAHTCAICYEGTRADRPWLALPCTHLFHAHCILQWVKVAHGNRTGLPACPMDQVVVTRRGWEAHNSWRVVAAGGGGEDRHWVAHPGGVYSSGGRRVRALPAGAIVMTPVVLEEPEEEEEEEVEGEEEGGGGEGGVAGGGGGGQQQQQQQQQQRDTEVVAVRAVQERGPSL